MIPGRLAAVVVVALGCSASPAAIGRGPTEALPPWKLVRSDEGGFEVSMPTAPEEKRASEGPVQMHLYASHDDDGVVYEVAFFDLPEPLADAERRRLLERVQAGLVGAPGAHLTGSRDTPTGGITGRELRIDLGDGREGTWRVLYVGDRRMFQISGVGPSHGLAKGTARFFGSFRLVGR